MTVEKHLTIIDVLSKTMQKEISSAVKAKVFASVARHLRRQRKKVMHTDNSLENFGMNSWQKLYILSRK